MCRCVIMMGTQLLWKCTEDKDASSLAALHKSTSGPILSTSQFQTNSRMPVDSFDCTLLNFSTGHLH